MHEKINKIKTELRPILAAFLNEDEYQGVFWQMAQLVGYVGDDDALMKASLFTVKGGDIGFVIGELNELFAEFQIKQIPLISDLISKHPEKKSKIIEFALNALKTGKLDEKAFEDLLK